MTYFSFLWFFSYHWIWLAVANQEETYFGFVRESNTDVFVHFTFESYLSTLGWRMMLDSRTNSWSVFPYYVSFFLEIFHSVVSGAVGRRWRSPEVFFNLYVGILLWILSLSLSFVQLFTLCHTLFHLNERNLNFIFHTLGSYSNVFVWLWCFICTGLRSLFITSLGAFSISNSGRA